MYIILQNSRARTSIYTSTHHFGKARKKNDCESLLSQEERLMTHFFVHPSLSLSICCSTRRWSPAWTEGLAWACRDTKCLSATVFMLTPATSSYICSKDLQALWKTICSVCSALSSVYLVRNTYLGCTLNVLLLCCSLSVKAYAPNVLLLCFSPSNHTAVI
jgi:hypothetical protein